jgi:uncharacterized protein (TIGR02001 family)
MGSARRARRPLAVLLGLLAAAPAGAAGFGATLGASSDNVFRGVSESAGDPSVQAGAHYAWNTGAFAGLRGATIKPRVTYGTRDTVELDAFAGYGAAWGDDWHARAMLVRYDYPWSDPRVRGYEELALDATWLGRLTLSAAAAPDKPGPAGRREAAYDYELALRWPVNGVLSLDAGAGYHDLRRTYGVAYAYWSAGAACTWRRATLTLAWIAADAEARVTYGEAADGRFVASVLWTP